jgi:hypothetical protein
MSDERPARRYPASAFPGIRGIRLTPPGAAATLVNLSASGMLVECAARLPSDITVTAHIAGSFVPIAIEGRVVRFEVAGIGPDGALRYHFALAFQAPIALAPMLEPLADAPEPQPGLPSEAMLLQAEDTPPGMPVLRNRW